jgi:hypothetical protein
VGEGSSRLLCRRQRGGIDGGAGESPAGRTDRGPKIPAYGRDPNFPGWPDTLQLDYANPELQGARIDELTAIAGKRDGVRCDMAMLLPEIFRAPGD